MTPILFLDFDGVLNHQAAVYTDEWPFDLILISRLNRLVAATNAIIIVTSNWRDKGDLQFLQRLLRNAGVKASVNGATGHAATRGEEIRAMLNAFPPDIRFVILDDLDTDDLKAYGHNFIQTVTADGLSDANVDRAIAVLNGT